MPSLKVASLRTRRRLRGAGSSGGGSLFRDLRGLAGAPPTLRVGTPRAPATVVSTCHVRPLLRRRKSPLPAAATPGVLRSLGVVRRDGSSPADGRILLFVQCTHVLSHIMGRKTGMLPYRIEVADDEAAVTAYAGLPLVLETMRTLGVSERAPRRAARHPSA